MNHNYKDIKIGNKLKQARLACGLTQEQVSEKLDCATRYIGQLEKDAANGSISTILALCTIYKITTNDLFSDYFASNDNTNFENIFGYQKLNMEHRRIVDNTIEFLNKLENEEN